MTLRSRFTSAIFSLALLLCCTAACLPAQPPQLHTATREELDVIKLLLKQEAAWNRGDLDTFVQTYKDSPDTLFLSGRVNHGYAGLLEEYRHDYPNKTAMGTLGFSELEVHGLGDKFALCVGKYHLERGKKEGGPADGLFSLVLEKTDQGWKIILDHTT